MKNVLRALVLTAILGVAAATAHAEVGIYFGVGAPGVAVVPPCPGAGYIWNPGYYNGPVFVPGQWIYGGYGRDDYFRGRDWDDYAPAYRSYYYRGDDHDYGRGWGRGYDRGNDFRGRR